MHRKTDDREVTCDSLLMLATQKITYNTDSVILTVVLSFRMVSFYKVSLWNFTSFKLRNIVSYAVKSDISAATYFSYSMAAKSHNFTFTIHI